MRENSLDRIKKNVLSLYGLQATSLILPMVTVPYLLRMLGANNYGRIAFAQSFIQYFIIFTEYGFNLYLTRIASLQRENIKLLSQIFFAALFIKLGLLIIGFLSLIIFVETVPAINKEQSLIFLLYLSVLGNVFLPVWLFQGLEMMKPLAVIGTGVQFLVMILILLTVNNKEDYQLAVLLQTIGSVSIGVISLIYLKAKNIVVWELPSPELIRSTLFESRLIFASNVAVSLYSNTTVFVLGLMTGTTTVGYFSAADKLIKVASSLFMPISQSLYPYLARLRYESEAKAFSIIANFLKIQGLFSVGIFIYLTYDAEYIVKLIFGSDFSGAVIALQIMSAIPFFVGLSNILGILVLMNFDLQEQYVKILIFSGLLSLVIIAPMILFFNILGAALALLVTEVVVVISMVICLKKYELLNRIIDRKYA